MQDWIIKAAREIDSGCGVRGTNPEAVERIASLISAHAEPHDFVLGLDTIIEADDDGFFDGSLQVNFARMNTTSANSFEAAFSAGTVFKGDLQLLGTYINSLTQRSMLFEFPALQVSGYKAVDASHGEIRPEVTFKLRLADAAPTGMAVTNPLRLTIVNSRSTNLLA